MRDQLDMALSKGGFDADRDIQAITVNRWPSMPLAAGTRLGLCEITAPIGAGGTGEVYGARDTRLGPQVALKVLPDSLRANTELRERLEREARANSQLQHPNVDGRWLYYMR